MLKPKTQCIPNPQPLHHLQSTRHSLNHNHIHKLRLRFNRRVFWKTVVRLFVSPTLSLDFDLFFCWWWAFGVFELIFLNAFGFWSLFWILISFLDWWWAFGVFGQSVTRLLRNPIFSCQPAPQAKQVQKLIQNLNLKIVHVLTQTQTQMPSGSKRKNKCRELTQNLNLNSVK